MIDLYAAGKLEQCTTFDVPLDIKNVYKINVDGNVGYSFLRGSLLTLEKKGVNPELCDAILYALQKQRNFKKLLSLLKKILKDILLRMKVI
jgi:hypothetical protein